jgi:hypothetical protein
MTARHDERADPLPRSITVDLSTHLVHTLRELSAGVADDSRLSESVVALLDDLIAAVPSSCGLQLIVTEHDYPVTVTAFVDPPNGEVRTSLRVPLHLLDPRFDAGRAVFYASTPGALRDLQYAFAHLGLLDRQVRIDPASRESAVEGGRRPCLVVDDDLPPSVQMSGVSGAEELTAINRAVGLLIADGDQPDHAHAALRRHAAAAGLEPHAWAIRLLHR